MNEQEKIEELIINSTSWGDVNQALELGESLIEDRRWWARMGEDVLIRKMYESELKRIKSLPALEALALTWHRHFTLEPVKDLWGANFHTIFVRVVFKAQGIMEQEMKVTIQKQFLKNLKAMAGDLIDTLNAKYKMNARTAPTPNFDIRSLSYQGAVGKIYKANMEACAVAWVEEILKKIA